MNEDHMEALGSCSVCGDKLMTDHQEKRGLCSTCIITNNAIVDALTNPDRRRWVVDELLPKHKCFEELDICSEQRERLEERCIELRGQLSDCQEEYWNLRGKIDEWRSKFKDSKSVHMRVASRVEEIASGEMTKARYPEDVAYARGLGRAAEAIKKAIRDEREPEV